MLATIKVHDRAAPIMILPIILAKNSSYFFKEIILHILHTVTFVTLYLQEETICSIIKLSWTRELFDCGLKFA